MVIWFDQATYFDVNLALPSCDSSLNFNFSKEKAMSAAARLTKQMFEQIKDSQFDNLSLEKLVEFLKLPGKISGKNNVENQINQVKAANTLAKMNNVEAVEPLLELIEHGELYPRLAASNALGRIGKVAVETLIPQLGKIIETQDKQPPMEAFWAKKFYVHDPAARTLVRIGKTAVSPLLQVVKSEKDDFVVQQALDALGRISDKAALEPLIAEFPKRMNALTQWKIIRAVGEIRDMQGTKLLRSVLKDVTYPPFVRWEAADGLGKIYSETKSNQEEGDELRVALADENEQVRRACARALKQIGDRRAIPALQKLLANSKPTQDNKSAYYEAYEAKEALQAMTPL